MSRMSINQATIKIRKADLQLLKRLVLLITKQGLQVLPPRMIEHLSNLPFSCVTGSTVVHVALSELEESIKKQIKRGATGV